MFAPLIRDAFNLGLRNDASSGDPWAPGFWGCYSAGGETRL